MTPSKTRKVRGTRFDAGRFGERVLAKSPGNARIEGQRRVGKTSLANALASKVEQLSPGTHAFVRVEAGDVGANTAEETVAS